jgi:hypothetical protein
MEFDTLDVMKRFDSTNKDVIAPLFDLGYSMLWTSEHRASGTDTFEHVRLAELTSAHETNSLAVFAQLDE